MKIEKIVSLNVELDKFEYATLEKAIETLRQIKETMEKYDCDTFKCCDEYTYDISNLDDTIADLKDFINITEIFA